MERSVACLLCIVIVGPQASAQDVPPETNDRSYALEAGKVEIGVRTGIYIIETTAYYPGPIWLIGGDVAVGLSPHVALQFGASRAGYENNLYWRPAVPHNPYRATADLLNFWAEARYEFRRTTARVRPYLGLGVVSTRFANVKRGPKDLCYDSTCMVVVPELFDGTKVTALFDYGLNFLIQPTWGIGAGIRSNLHRGDESDPNPGIGSRPSGGDLFWHHQVYVGVFYRWKRPARSTP